MNRRAFLERAAAAALAGTAGCSGSGSGSSATRPRSVPPPAPRRPTLADLRSAVRGPVLVPGDRGYTAARTVYNERYDGIHPRAVAVAASEQDVRACVEWASRAQAAFAARSGGHSYGGYSTTHGVVCDVRGLNRIAIAPDGKTVEAGAGCMLFDLVSALAARGLAVPSGSCPTVGLAGVALGGGVGLAARAFGTTSDNLLSVRIATAGGGLLEVGPRSHPDLYWACRGGGGGNFGVATSFTLRTHPVGHVSYVFCDFPWSQAGAAVEAWQGLAPHAPDELYLLCSLATDPSGPRVRAFGQLLGGDEARLRSLVGPLAAVPGAFLTTGSATYLDAQRIWAGCAGETDAACLAFSPTRFGARSDYAGKPFPAAAISAAAGHIEARQSHTGGSGALLLDPYGGALNRVAADATAFVHRDQLFSCQYLAYSTGPADMGAAETWLTGFHAAMRPYVSGQAYQNYIDPTLAGWEQAYYGANLSRLEEVKRTYDPEGVFRFRQSIPA